MRVAPSILAAQYAKCGMTMPLPEKPAPVRLARIDGVYRSKLERDYSRHLSLRMRAGELDGYWYEAWEFALGARRTYTPDFLLEFPDGRREWHEVKGYMWRAAATKLDWFVATYPGERLVVVTRDKGRWIYTERTGG